MGNRTSYGHLAGYDAIRKSNAIKGNRQKQIFGQWVNCQLESMKEPPIVIDLVEGLQTGGAARFQALELLSFVCWQGRSWQCC